MDSECPGSNSPITDEEFQRIRSQLYQSATFRIEKIAKMVLNSTNNLTTLGSSMDKAEIEILNVFENTDFLIEDSCVGLEETNVSGIE